jgi:hypothetical protein
LPDPETVMPLSVRPHIVPCTVALLAAATVASAQSTRYDDARVEYEIGHFEKAFTEFARLADEGHCDAGRTALHMVRYGRALYATEFKVTPERLARWQQMNGCPAIAVARH